MKTSKTSKTYKLQGNCFTDSRDLHMKVTDSRDYKVFSVFIRTYSSEEEVIAFLRAADLDEYAYILHDHDVKEDGSPKEPHYHILCYRKSGFRLTPAFRAFTQNTLIQPCRSRCHSYQYLIHKNDPDKAQYSEADIHQYHLGDKNTFIHTLAEQKDNQYAQMLDDLAQLGYRELAIKYGRDYMLNYERYERFMAKIAYEQSARDIDNYVHQFNKVSTLDDVYILSEADGDTIRLDASSWFASELTNELEKRDSLPNASEILTWYADLLSQYQEYQRQLKKNRRNPLTNI